MDTKSKNINEESIFQEEIKKSNKRKSRSGNIFKKYIVVLLTFISIACAILSLREIKANIRYIIPGGIYLNGDLSNNISDYINLVKDYSIYYKSLEYASDNNNITQNDIDICKAELVDKVNKEYENYRNDKYNEESFSNLTYEEQQKILSEEKEKITEKYTLNDEEMKEYILNRKGNSASDLNNKINNNLLEQALTLYATQFSSLELNGCIGDYCSVKSGFAFKSSWWTNSGIRVIKIGSINQDNLNLLECSYVDEDKADKAKDFVVKAGDLLIAMTGATIGKFAMVPYSSEMLLVNQRVGKFFLGNNPVEKLPFIYCTLKQPEVYGEVVNRGQGSAQPNISASDIMSIPCVIPSQDAINDFNNTSQPLFDLIISNQRENQHLSELRNALLPKLMSGELDVSNIEI